MSNKSGWSHTGEIRPCRHMEAWIGALADGSLTGVARWYATLHVAGCRRCARALAMFERIVAQLRGLRVTAELPSALGTEHRDALREAMDVIDRSQG